MTLVQILAAADAQGLGVHIKRDLSGYSNLGLWNAQFYTNRDGTDVRTCQFGATAEEAVEKAWAAFTPFAARLPALAGPPPAKAKLVEGSVTGRFTHPNDDIPF